MGSSLSNALGAGSAGNDLGYGQELQCCEAVVDPVSLLATIGTIAATSLFLRQAVIDFMVMGGRRRRDLLQASYHLVEG